MTAERDIMIGKIQAWVKENPNRGRTVAPIEIRVCSDTQEGESEVGPASTGGWVPTPLEPPGPVSLWLWKTDPEFRAATAQVRRTILRDQILKLTERAEQELRGVKWQRKKVVEQLAAQQTAAVSPPMETPELDRALAHLFGYQKVVVDEAGKKLRFFPADPRTWSTELPVWAGTTGARAVLHRPGEGAIGRGLARWLQEREGEGWSVEWPVAEGGIEDLKARLEERGLRAGRSGLAAAEKPKKADYAAALGRAETIEHLMGTEWA